MIPYLTIDQGIIFNEKSTLREPGWHIDGMQEKASATNRSLKNKLIFFTTIANDRIKNSHYIKVSVRYPYK